MALNVKNMKLWVKALRSGKYKQGQGQLRYAGRLCCLGVACDISKLGKWDEDKYLGNTLDLPQPVMDWLGLKSGDPTVGSRCLSSYNDEAGKTFNEIADIIEREYDLKNR